MRKSFNQQGFTLIELLVVVGIIAVLAALLFSVFGKARSNARQSSCLSNQRQIGVSVSMYAQDYDDFFPFAINPSDHAHPERWNAYPDFMARIPVMAQFHEVLQPYINSSEVFHCLSDTGLKSQDPFPGWVLNASPSSYAVFKTSYFYDTDLAAAHAQISTLRNASNMRVLMDGGGTWHGSTPPVFYETSFLRYNVLFADNHIKNINHHQLRFDSPLP